MPFCRDIGEKVELGAREPVGVAEPELGREPDRDDVDSNSLCNEGFERRYGSEDSDEAGDARCLGSIIEASTSAAYLGGLGVASWNGVMGSAGGAP